MKVLPVSQYVLRQVIQLWAEGLISFSQTNKLLDYIVKISYISEILVILGDRTGRKVRDLFIFFDESLYFLEFYANDIFPSNKRWEGGKIL